MPLLDTRMEASPLVEVPVPANLRHRARDDRGVPIPGTVYVRGQDPAPYFNLVRGFVDYTYIDWVTWATCAQEKRCGYCRHGLDYWIYFVGHQSEVYSRTFTNLAMHDQCVHYFLQVYPTVAFPRMRDAPRSEGGGLPSRLGVYMTRDYKVIAPPGSDLTSAPNYRVRAGTQHNVTMWVEYEHALIEQFNDVERRFYESLLGGL